jgi:hypothetical protein
VNNGLLLFKPIYILKNEIMKIKNIIAIGLIVINIAFLSNALTAQVDTLIIRSACYYGEKELGKKTKCFSYSDLKNSEFQQFVSEHGKDVLHLEIENPSKILYSLDFSKFSNLRSVVLVGNDSDFLTALHPEMMKISSLKKIELNGITVPELEVERIKKLGSTIDVIGLDGVSSYTYGNDTVFDLTIVVNKNGKYALWSYPYETEPQYLFDHVEKLGYGKYICYSETGCEFVNTRLNNDQKYTLCKELWYSYPDVSDPLGRYVVNNHGAFNYHGIKYFELTGKLDADGNFATTEKKEVSDSLAVIFGGFFGLLSPDFKVIIPAVYTQIQFPAKVHYRELANVVPDTLREFANWLDCSELYSPTDHAKMNINELILLDSGEVIGACDFDGKMVIPMVYRDIIPIIEGGITRYYCFVTDRKGVVLDHKGAKIEDIALSSKNRLQYPRKSDERTLAERPDNSQNIKELIPLMQEIIGKQSVRFYDDIATTHAATRVPEKITSIYVTEISVPETGDKRTVFSLSLIDATKGIKAVVRFNDLVALWSMHPELMKQLVKIGGKG